MHCLHCITCPSSLFLTQSASHATTNTANVGFVSIHFISQFSLWTESYKVVHETRYTVIMILHSVNIKASDTQIMCIEYVICKCKTICRVYVCVSYEIVVFSWRPWLVRWGVFCGGIVCEVSPAPVPCAGPVRPCTPLAAAESVS